MPPLFINKHFKIIKENPSKKVWKILHFWGGGGRTGLFSTLKKQFHLCFWHHHLPPPRPPLLASSAAAAGVFWENPQESESCLDRGNKIWKNHRNKTQLTRFHLEVEVGILHPGWIVGVTLPLLAEHLGLGPGVRRSRCRCWRGCRRLRWWWRWTSISCW